MGKMQKLPQFKHDGKPTEITLRDGRVVKPIQGTEDPSVLVNTRVITL